ncbi:MAG: hypothetical protein EXS16_14225 [Gemmataceae bacterium]|nr:hypothetical protein [Gemmataceae bacterium]
MQFVKGLTVAVLFVVPIMLSAGEPGKLREIEMKGGKVGAPKKNPFMPTIITNAEELKKAIPEADEAIQKQIEFAKDKLVLFTWSGSGGDKLNATLSEDGKTATFTRKLGLTRDFRMHVRLFAIPATAEFKVTIGK